jgi:hypothetical protein
VDFSSVGLAAQKSLEVAEAALLLFLLPDSAHLPPDQGTQCHPRGLIRDKSLCRQGSLQYPQCAGPGGETRRANSHGLPCELGTPRRTLLSGSRIEPTPLQGSTWRKVKQQVHGACTCVHMDCPGDGFCEDPRHSACTEARCWGPPLPPGIGLRSLGFLSCCPLTSVGYLLLPGSVSAVLCVLRSQVSDFTPFSPLSSFVAIQKRKLPKSY